MRAGADARGASPEGPRTPFEIRIGALGFGDLAVVHLRGAERISRCYAFDVTFALTSGEADEAAAASAIFEQEATLRIAAAEGAHRLVRGVVTRLRAEGIDARGRLVFRARLAPRLALLAHGQESRIFQDRSLPQILDAVLTARGVAHRFALVGPPHPARAYCVQHQESDLAFVARLCAEDGVFFWFEQPPADPDGEAPEAVIFGDSSRVYPQIPGESALAFRRADGPTALDLEERHVTRFSRRRASAPRGTWVRGYDFERPTTRLEARAGEAGARVVYEHHDEDERVEIDADKATTVLEQARARADLADGASPCRRLSPGHRFSLEDHDVAALNGAYVLTRVEHEGHAPNLSGRGAPAYEARFRAAPSDVAIRPRRPRRTARQVLETATVVGPRGQEIHTDAHGRVKVQFHWDREGKGDEHSSCWLRVAQAWAGTGFGFQFIPRVGMEVLVGFLGGDLDRPVVIGALYNATHPPSFKLPEERTKSGIRSRSTPASDGWSELSFEDRAGEEQISLRAQRDLSESVERDHTESVGRDKAVTVAGKHVVRVLGDRDEHIAGALAQRVEGGASVSVSGDSRSTTQGSVDAEILQNRSVVVRGTDVTTVLGASTTVVQGPQVLRVDAEHTLLVGEGRDDGQAEVAVSRKYLLSSGSTIRIRAEDSILLSAGDSMIELTPRGVTITAKAVDLRGSEGLSASGPGPALRLGDEAEIVSKVVKIYAEGSAIEMDRDARVNGEHVLLNCDGQRPSRTDDEDEARPKQRFSLKLTDEAYAPYASKRYRMVCEGERFEGTTSADGRIEHEVEKGAKTAQITVWLGEYPTGAVKRYAVQIEALPDPGSIAGAQVRLKNLGYYQGAGKGVIDDETRAALSAFQRDHALEATGELDEATQSALVERHES